MGLSLLIVDDEPDAAEMLARLLRCDGFEARVAFSGKQALETVTSFQPDVVILDIGMPILDGYQLARQLRALPELAHKVFIALTAYSDQEHLDQASHAQFDEYLVKPLKRETLLAILGEVAKGHYRR